MQLKRNQRFCLAAVLVLGVAGWSGGAFGEESAEVSDEDEELSEADQALNKAFELHEEGDLDAAYDAFQDLADQGDAEAKVQLGWMYLEGHTMDPDMERTAELWERAAEAGHERAGQLLNAVLPGVEH
ncbi:sel1 repeat family protein [Halorhodospira halophila]|nr:sel1 repeat family protein [Halorhodospira halophila]MBK1729431.1 sel1 repeat family protein [Halorhodospira halophila]